MRREQLLLCFIAKVQQMLPSGGSQRHIVSRVLGLAKVQAEYGKQGAYLNQWVLPGALCFVTAVRVIAPQAWKE
jgi:hypothetical protein